MVDGTVEELVDCETCGDVHPPEVSLCPYLAKAAGEQFDDEQATCDGAVEPTGWVPGAPAQPAADVNLVSQPAGRVGLAGLRAVGLGVRMSSDLRTELVDLSQLTSAAGTSVSTLEANDQLIPPDGALVDVIRQYVRDLNVPQIDVGIQHRGDEGMPKHVRMQVRQGHDAGRGEAVQSAGGCDPVHPAAALVAQQRTGGSAVNGPAHRPGNSRWQRPARSCRPCPEAAAPGDRAAHRDRRCPRRLLRRFANRADRAGNQREVIDARRVASHDQQRLQLQMGRPQRRRLGRHIGTTHMLGREWASTSSITQVR